jgi:hypothetical protein
LQLHPQQNGKAGKGYPFYILSLLAPNLINDFIGATFLRYFGFGNDFDNPNSPELLLKNFHVGHFGGDQPW